MSTSTTIARTDYRDDCFVKGYHPSPGDVNNIALIGTYFTQDTACSNLPTSNGLYYMVTCFGIYQIASRHGVDGFVETYTREYINDKWYPWTKVGTQRKLIYNNVTGVSSGDIELTETWRNFSFLIIETKTNIEYFSHAVSVDNLYIYGQSHSETIMGDSTIYQSTIKYVPKSGDTTYTKLTISHIGSTPNWVQKIINIWGYR